MTKFEFTEENTAQPQKRGPGRPKGTPNKSFTQKMILEQFEDLYGRVEAMLTPDQKRYYKEAFSGRGTFDPLKDGELFARLYSVYCITITTEALALKKPSKEVAENVGQYRQMLKDLEDINRRREEWKVKTGERGDMVDPTRESALGRIQDILGRDSRE